MRKPRQRNSTRDREKAELVSLRALVNDLQIHLTALNRGETPTRSQSSWQRLSIRQAQARQAAEETNQSLNARVQSNADWIQRLWELLHESRRVAESADLRRTAGLQRKAEDDRVLNQLKQQAQSGALNAPGILAKHGIHLFDGIGCTTETDLWSHTRSDRTSTLVCARQVPFDAHATSDAMWAALTRPEGSFASESGAVVGYHEITSKARVLERTSDACTMKLREYVQDQNQDATSLNYHAVIKRSALQNASVFVWKSLFTLGDGSTKHHDSMWVVVARCGLESTVVIVCESQLQGSEELISVQDSIMPAVEACVNKIFSAAETKLLKEGQCCISHARAMQTFDV
ncbi:hypothetical protein P3T76_008128 [Phytophthora citrophthora]|uniref:Uncharacterized protein n=1 Tax=Phytophthora citrophthora TaxID=4793 RepID=A0AAD9GLI9_9STRA|nr:hypothetical protein P3T76_008128 [Phytophthora citrophthora]